MNFVALVFLLNRLQIPGSCSIFNRLKYDWFANTATTLNNYTEYSDHTQDSLKRGLPLSRLVFHWCTISTFVAALFELTFIT